MDNKYLSEFQYVGSTIKSLRIRNDFIDLDNNSNKTKRKLDVSHQVLDVTTYDNDTMYIGTIILNIKLSLTIEKRKYILNMAMEGCFNAPAHIGREMFEKMMQINGLTSLYSIARGTVQSVAAQTLMSGNIILPMFNVVEYSKDLNKEVNEK